MVIEIANGRTELTKVETLLTFYPRDALLARSLPSKDVLLSVLLSVSHAGVVSKRLNLS